MMRTVAPGSARAPEPGDWALTVPLNDLLGVGAEETLTPNPARLSVLVAWPWDRPTTLGTVADGDRSVLTPIVTTLPAVAVVPPPGDWETTVPAGCVESTVATLGVKSAPTRMSTA